MALPLIIPGIVALGTLAYTGIKVARETRKLQAEEKARKAASSEEEAPPVIETKPPSPDRPDGGGRRTGFSTPPKVRVPGGSLPLNLGTENAPQVDDQAASDNGGTSPLLLLGAAALAIAAAKGVSQ